MPKRRRFMPAGRSSHAGTKRSSKTLWLLGGAALGLAVLLVGGVFWFSEGSSVDGSVGSELGQIAPDWTLPEADGGNVSRSDFEGMPLVLVFYRTYT